MSNTSNQNRLNPPECYHDVLVYNTEGRVETKSFIELVTALNYIETLPEKYNYSVVIKLVVYPQNIVPLDFNPVNP